MGPRAEEAAPPWAKPLRCPACQSSNVHIAPREGEHVVIVCVNCYQRWAVSLEPDTTSSPDVA